MCVVPALNLLPVAMATRIAALAGHVVPQTGSAAPAWPPAAPSHPFAGFDSPTGLEYKRGTSPSVMGNMEPACQEIEGSLQLIHGALPAGLEGRFLRNGPNPSLEQWGNTRYHEFEGDGMIHSVHLQDGQATYANRFIQTKRKMLQQEKGRPLKQHELMTADGYLGTGNTNLVYHAKKLMALYEVDKPYVLSLPQLETIGLWTAEGSLSHNVTAHPKVCPDTEELIFFGYAFLDPIVRYAVADKSGKLLRSFDIPTRCGKPVMMHDMAITKNFSILMEFPLYLEMSRVAKGNMPYVHDVNLPSQFGILPRHAESASDVRWFSAKSAYSFHIVNAWEECEVIRLVGCPQERFSFEYGESQPSVLYEWVFDLQAGTTTERQLHDLHIEFPVINPALTGKQNRYTWAAVFAGPGMPFHSISGCVKYDLKTGQHIRHDFLGGRWGGESVFAPVGDGEDSGFLLTYTFNPQDKSTELYIVDAKTMDPNPLAILRTPQRVPFGFHGLWVPRED